MMPLTEPAIRESFVNATRGEVRRLHLPDLTEVGWDALDFLGWVDPKAPQQAALVAPTPDGPIGVRLRRNVVRGMVRAKMCSLCLTTHPGSGVTLMVAPRAGRAGREGNSTGVDVCADLRCSLYVRGLVPLPTMSRVTETTSVEDRVERLRGNVAGFLARVTRPVEQRA